ncbi:MAG: hypothetical protein KA447_13720 [Pyrinomonadaceae bacterium]|nr:hypothetical protein [Pyrinomonadaceae bacterium]
MCELMRMILAVLVFAIVFSSCAKTQDMSVVVPMVEPTPLSIVNKVIAPDWPPATPENCKPKRGWCEGTYRGLTAGQSTFADMVRILGQPSSSGPAEDDPKSLWNDYGKISGEVAGRLAIITDKSTKKIVWISIAPDEMTKQQVIELFGPDFQEMGYSFCTSTADETSLPIYEDKDSTQLRNIEYRSRGISISVGFRDQVTDILFVSEPAGLASRKECKAALR